MEKANVTGNRKKAENYRPISVTSICCRTMEKLIRYEIVNHLEHNQIISKNQHGFRKGYSCATQLLTCLEEWTNAIDQGHDVDVIYTLNLKLPSTKCHIKDYLKKIWEYGIRGNLFNWVEDFLKNRLQRVIVSGSQSGWGPVISGVLQGSVLGPVLFLVFINDIPVNIQSPVYLFADDTKICRTIKNNDDSNSLQDDIFEACNWANKWQLTFNTNKCKHTQQALNVESTLNQR